MQPLTEGQPDNGSSYLKIFYRLSGYIYYIFRQRRIEIDPE